jgi:hypothetical protein
MVWQDIIKFLRLSSRDSVAFGTFLERNVSILKGTIQSYYKTSLMSGNILLFT